MELCACPYYVYRYHPGGKLCICGHVDSEHKEEDARFGPAPLGPCTHR